MTVSVSADTSSLAVTPGTASTCIVTVRNGGTVVDSLDLAVLGKLQAWATVTPPSIRLFPGEQAQAVVTVEPPRSAEVVPGALPFGVLARSQETGETAVVELEAVVGGFAEVNAELRPKRVTAKRVGRFTVFVDNFGNQDTEVAIGAADENDELDFSIRPDRIAVPGGTAATASLRAQTVKRPFFGAAEQHPFDVTVVAQGAPVLHLGGSLHVKPVVPRFLPVALLLVGLLIAALLFVRSQNSEVESDARLRAQPIAFNSPSPFTPSIATDPPPGAPELPPTTDTTAPPDTAATATTEATTTTESTTTTEQPTTTAAAGEEQEAEVADVVAAVGGDPGAYASQRGSSPCDVAQYKEVLEEDGERAALLAGFLGTDVSGLLDGIERWTPGLITADTWVVDHDFVGGSFQPVPALMQAGTAVLADENGQPRIRCQGGTPLATPNDTSFEPSVLGELWPALEEDDPAIQVLGPAPDVLGGFVMVVPELITTFPPGTHPCTTSSGGVNDDCFARPVGTAGAADRDATPADIDNGVPVEDTTDTTATTGTTTDTTDVATPAPGAHGVFAPGIYTYDIGQTSGGQPVGAPIVAQLVVFPVEGRTQASHQVFPDHTRHLEVLIDESGARTIVSAQRTEPGGASTALDEFDPAVLDAPADLSVGDTWTATMPAYLAASAAPDLDPTKEVQVQSEILGVQAVGDQGEAFVVARRYGGTVPDVFEYHRTTDWLLLRLEYETAPNSTLFVVHVLRSTQPS